MTQFTAKHKCPTRSFLTLLPQINTDTACYDQEKNAYLLASPLEEKEKSETFQLWLASQGASFCLGWLGVLMELVYLRCLGVTENKRKIRDLVQLQRTCSTTARHQRKQKTTISCKWNQQTYLLQNYTHKPGEDTSPQNAWEALWMPSQAGWWRSSPSTKPVHKDWERWLFFQMHKTQQKLVRHLKKQGNMTQSKEKNKSPEINPKETEIYELLDNSK